MSNYTSEALEQMADRHDAHSVCTYPAKDHFAQVCRALAAELRRDEIPDGSYSFGELGDTGMLWLINTSVFHPRGVALAIHRDDQGRACGWKLVAAGPGEAFDFVPGPDIDRLFRQAEVTLSLAERPTTTEGGGDDA
jgi:hypothetical protein